ncbi:CCA tRNA nucleotidyltransferase [Rubellimicrobium aerolatum]|uniref:CCA tRNA nucleotidyltransferase n=1 Tax=Rubellimicrobium aerolatum TaxID=490979 RepID=A0ABW0SA50_9RHOB|nr:CCA tRNA nucleotidyltransferase [Rubellimicrobium aerolatum]MBP1805168.1 poly(A) polymerase [Rubellimicrobium aerolatum]
MTDPIPAALLSDPSAARVLRLLGEGGHRAWIVGGAVRDALLGRPVGDIDVTTDAPPERVAELAGQAGLKALPTGIEHGTVTLLAPRPVEVTTLRRDVETDGRHATVAFGTEPEEDARRRDFTMNALYLTADGALLDPTGGLPDLHARRIRFVGDASTRIREDYLRALRYFRFHAQVGDPEEGLDPDALDAIARNLDGLDTLSRERVGHEMLRLLATPDPAPAVAAMRATGALARVLPGAGDGLLAPLVHIEGEAGLPPDPLRRLAALGGEDVPEALRLSRQQAKRLDRLLDGMGTFSAPGELGYRLGEAEALDVLALRAALSNAHLDPEAARLARHGAGQRFPLAAADLAPLAGPALGHRLRALERAWIDSGFALSPKSLRTLPEEPA